MSKLTAVVFALFLFLISCQSVEKKSAGADTGTVGRDGVRADRTKADIGKGDTPLNAVPDTMRNNQYAINTYREEAARTVRDKLRKDHKDALEKGLLDSMSRMFMIYEVDLNGDLRDEIFVAQMGKYFCGSGGCTVLLLKNNGREITKFTVTELPILISNALTNGWKDLYVKSGGKYHLLKSDGKTYPSNPSTAPLLKGNPPEDIPKVIDFDNQPYLRFHF